jgi:opacity protein-like surface antigen
MRKAILGAASALAIASPAVAADVPVTPYSEGPRYEREVHTYGYRTAPLALRNFFSQIR